MARPKGSKNKPKGAKKAADEGATPGIGHNDLTEEQRAALLFQAVGKIEREQVKMREHVAAIRLIRKQAKADGVSAKELNWALELRKSDPDEALATMAMQTRVAKWMGHPIGTQADLFGDGVDRTPSVEKAYGEGRVAGMAGDACIVPEKWAPGGEQHQRWLDGWHDGQRVILEGIKPLEEAAAAPGLGDTSDAPGSYTMQ